MKIHRTLVPALMAAAISTVAAAAAPQSPEDFLKHLYAGYAPGKTPLAFDYRTAGSFVDDSMIALLRRDDKMSNGEVGAIDSDPICQCQDWDGMKVLSIHSKLLAPGHAK